MVFLQIILGVLTTAFLIFLRNAHLKAHKQKMVATRLRSYLLHWQKLILDNDLFSFFYMGIEWNEKIEQILRDGGGAKELVALEKDKKKELNKVKEQITAASDKAKLDKEKIQKIVAKIPHDAREQILQYVHRHEQNLIDGKTFITDEEACYLGIYVAQTSIELKMTLISLINTGMGVLLEILRNPEGFELKEHADNIARTVWYGIIASKHIHSLTKQMDVLTKQSVLDLTIKNLRDEL
jgi:hypothetical protein